MGHLKKNSRNISKSIWKSAKLERKEGREEEGSVCVEREKKIDREKKGSKLEAYNLGRSRGQIRVVSGQSSTRLRR